MEPIKYFFSYSRQNSEFVLRLATDLKLSGVMVWLDQTDIAPGSRWDDCIEHALKECNGLIIILSQASVKSQNVLDEVSFAIDQGKRIVPLMIETCMVPFRLARFQQIDFTANYDTAFQKLFGTLSGENDGGVKTGRPPVPPTGDVTHTATPTGNKKDALPLTRQQEVPLKTRAMVNKVLGLLFIVFAVVITLAVQCPGRAQYFIIYALTGLGIALLFTKGAEKANATFKVWNTSVVVAGGVALPFILFFTNPIGAFKPDNCDVPLGVTVFVHGNKGRQDMVLRQQGHVMMDLKGGERKKADINENGAAYFQNLHAGDSVRLEIDFTEPYKAISPDSTYVITADSRIYLPIALQGIDKVEGIVLYRDLPLEGVTVKIGSLTGTTGKTGDFSVSIPAAQQKKEYKVWFMKDGFKSKSAPAFPQTGQSLEIVMEK